MILEYYLNNTMVFLNRNQKRSAMRHHAIGVAPWASRYWLQSEK